MLTMYPAVFIPEPDGRYSVLLPDFDCATCGDDLTDALEMAVDCMAGEVYTMQKEHQESRILESGCGGCGGLRQTPLREKREKDVDHSAVDE